MHHQSLAGLQARPPPQRNMRGAKHHRKSRAVFPGHGGWHRRAAVRVGDHLFGVTAMRNDGDHPIPDRNFFHACAEFQHLAGQFKAGTERRLRLLLVLTASDQAIGEIDPAGPHPDAHLMRSRARLRDLLQAQRRRAGQFTTDHRFHLGKSSMVTEKNPSLSWTAREGNFAVAPSAHPRGAESSAAYSLMILRTTSVMEMTPIGLSFSVTTRRLIRRPVI